MARLSRMGWDEIHTRIRQETGKRWDVLLYRLGLDPCRGARSDSESRGRFYCDPEDVPRVIEVLRRRMPEQADAILARAERILNGRFDLLGRHGLDFGHDIDWSLDPVHGKRAPFIPWPAIRFLNFAEMGDHKVIWELNRLQFLVTLAKAYRMTGDERFAAGLEDLWYDWRRKNPYPMGVNWASTLEVAFRTLSLMWAAFLLEGTPADSEAFQRDTTREIARSAWYISRFLSTYFSPNTHLLGEGTALLLIGLRYPGLADAGQWRKTGWRIVCEEARRQVRADGLHFEQSIYYHVYALDFFLHTRLMAARNSRRREPCRGLGTTTVAGCSTPPGTAPNICWIRFPRAPRSFAMPDSRPRPRVCAKRRCGCWDQARQRHSTIFQKRNSLRARRRFRPPASTP